MKKINWKVRFKNRVFLWSLISLIVTFVYNTIRIFGIVPSITQNTVLQIASDLLTILAALGIIVDPTTAGIVDSARALSYEEPWDDAAQSVVGEEEANG